MEGKLALFQMPAAGGGGGVDICLRVGSPPIGKQWVRAFTDRRRGLRAETAQSALTSSSDRSSGV